jgi:benzylsuccinate CoA-transferase BbsF subunit
MSRLPLKGILVVDFTWVGAGPFTTKILADSGAEVIKIESGARPDVLRLTPPYKDKKEGINRSGYFANRNTSKRSFQLNMKHQSSRELVKRLISKADVVANSFTPGTMEKWGLGYEEVKKINEKIIYLSMPMQGTTGPHKDYMGFGSTINALIGFNHLTGLPDREPIGTGTNYPDHVPNPCHAAFAILAALRQRAQTGKGQYIEVAQTESALCVLAGAIMDMAVNNRMQIRQGNWESYAVPHGAYPCQGEDRWCVISCTNDEEWHQFLEATGMHHLAQDPRFCTFSSRMQHRAELDQMISRWTEQYSAEEVMMRLQKHGVPAGVVQNAKDIVDHDPQMKHRQHLVRLSHPEMGLSLYNNVPFKMSESQVGVRKAAPLLGEDTEYVCKTLIGLSDEEFERYKEEGIFN